MMMEFTTNICVHMYTYRATHRQGEKSCVLKMNIFMFSEFAIKSHSQGSP